MTSGVANGYASCGSEQAGEAILFMDVAPGETFTISQVFNDFDSLHSLRVGGSCPGEDSLECIDDDDYDPVSYTNSGEALERVFYMIDGYMTDVGSFTVAWLLYRTEDGLDGGWSDYGDWGECSRPCGGGTQSRSRTCTNPAPANGGKDCAGKSYEMKHCNMQACVTVTACERAVDLRTLQSPHTASTADPSLVSTPSTCGSDLTGEAVFYIDLAPGEELWIEIISTGFDTMHSLRYGGSCPGEHELSCIDSDHKEDFAINDSDETLRVYYVVDGYDDKTGSFTFRWNSGTCKCRDDHACTITGSDTEFPWCYVDARESCRDTRTPENSAEWISDYACEYLSTGIQQVLAENFPLPYVHGFNSV